MIAIAWLLAALALAYAPAHPLARGAAVVCACIAGTTLPDADAWLPLAHRSALTHSVLPATVLLAPRWRAVAAGLAVGIGWHLAADCFPNAMTGYATVKWPFAGSMGVRNSYLWLAANAGVAGAAGLWLLGQLFARREVLVVAVALAAIGVAYLFVTDGGWPALGVYGLLGWMAVRRCRRAG